MIFILGEKLTRAEAAVREQEQLQLGLPSCLLDLPGNVTIDPLQAGQDNAPWSWLNHSILKPNVKAVAVRVPVPGKVRPTTHMVLVTTSIVPPGFEYRWNYDRISRPAKNGRPDWWETS